MHIAVLATLPLVTAVSFADAEVPVRLARGESVRAAHIEDDGSGVLVVGGAGSGSWLVFFDSKLSVSKVSVPGITIADRIQRVGTLAERRYVATTVTNAEDYGYVLLERANDRMRVVWSSANLALAKTSEPHVAISPDGKSWVAVAETANGKLAVQLGAIPSYEPFLKIESTTATKNAPRGADNAVVTWINSDRKNPLVAVQWLSVVHLFGSEGGKTLRSTLSAFPVTGMRWQPSTRTLWAEQKGMWLGYSIEELQRGARTRTGAKATRRVDPASVQSRITAFEPLADGGVAVVAPPDRGRNRAIRMYNIVNDRLVVRGQTEIPPRMWRLSPSGRALITLPAAAQGEGVRVRWLR